MKNYKEEEVKYLNLLSEKFPTIQEVCTEIINLQAILNLPKGTEHFLSDLHGEYESFLHILKNASGVIRSKIDQTFGDSLTNEEKQKLATLIYYPEEKLEIVKKETENLEEYYKITLYQLIEVCKVSASKYSRSKVRKAIPKEYEYIIDELLHSNSDYNNKEYYYNQIIHTIVSLDRADAFIIAISKLIQQLAIDHLHIIGDIYDRGPGPHIIIEELMKYHSIDIQWGNHDMVWMGAASGSAACMFNVIRMCARYDNLDILEETYGINIRSLTEFVMEEYKEETYHKLRPKNYEKIKSEFKGELLAKLQKATAVIQFKLEAEIIQNRPEFEMESRLFLDKIDYEKAQVEVDGSFYPMEDMYFPTVNPQSPYELTDKEQEVVDKIVKAFEHSEKLQKHIRFLFAKGNLYKIFNGNLLIHGCVPMEENGDFTGVKLENRSIKGKEYLDCIERIVRQGYFAEKCSDERSYGQDLMWYLWCGKYSPIFCRDAMKTFEQYFIDNKELSKEKKNVFYQFIEDEEYCREIFEKLDLDIENGHIICGHFPVKIKAGESPIKSNGKLLIIDGGLSKAYQKTTGIAGFTLIYNSYGLVLAAHEPFTSAKEAILKETDLHSSKQVVEKVVERKNICDTDIGLELKKQIKELENLLEAYKSGVIKEKHKKFYG